MFYKGNEYLEDFMTASEALKKIRSMLYLSQRELADELLITKSTICNYEKGKRNPSPPTIRKILAFAKKNNIKISLNINTE